MRKINSTIINAELKQIPNEKTGVVNEYTTVKYTMERENSDIAVGVAIMECWIPKNCLDAIKGYIMKPVQMELREIFNDKGCKFRISKINNNAI